MVRSFFQELIVAISARNRSSSSERPIVRLPAAPLAHRERVVRLAVAVDDREGDLLQLGLADPLPERLVALVDVDAEPSASSRSPQLVDGPAVVLGDRDQPQLHRREPEGERAGVVLGEDADEPLERAEQGAVDDDRRVLGVVGPM